MKPAIIIPVLGLLFVAFLLAPTVQALDWGVNINPTDPGEYRIFAGKNVVISVTGPDDANVFVEIIDANTTNTVIRFPDIGFTPLVDGVAIITWTIPATFPIALYYVSVTDDIDSVRDVRSFRVMDPTGILDPTDPEDDATLEEMLQDLIRLESWRNGFERSYRKTMDNLFSQLRVLWVLVLISLVMGVISLLGAFKERVPALRTLFKGDEEDKENETEDELRKLIRFVVRREIPTEFGHMFDDEWWNDIVSKRKKAETTSKEVTVAEPAREPKSVPELPAKGQKMYTRKCGYRNCGRTFLAKHPAALYCPDRNCRILEFKAKKRDKARKEKEGKDE